MVTNPEGKRVIGRRRRRWKQILKWILGKYGGECRMNLSRSKQGAIAMTFEHGNKTLGPIKDWSTIICLRITALQRDFFSHLQN